MTPLIKRNIFTLRHLFFIKRVRKLFVISVFLMSLMTTFSVSPGKADVGGLATDCDIFVSPTGTGNGSQTNPASLNNAVKLIDVAKSKTVICLLPGTYNRTTPVSISKSGNSTNWITFKAYQPGTVWIKGGAALRGSSFFNIGSSSPVHHIRLIGLKADGGKIVRSFVKCSTSSHRIHVLNNYMANLGAAGVATKNCDYVSVIGNKIYNVGFDGGWSSGVSYNSHVWVDQAPGFHSYVLGNIIAGVYDCCGSTRDPANPGEITDGNGIIMDRGGNTPPTLVANNVIYQNGGRCIHTKSSSNTWVVNNTCYKNLLDTRMENYLSEYTVQDSTKNYHLNNLVLGWHNTRYSFKETGSSSTSVYRANMWWQTSPPNGLPAYGPHEIRQADPKFVGPLPVVAPYPGNKEYLKAINPVQIIDQFKLQAGSPAINAGIDPTTLTTDQAIKAGLQQYVFKDIKGISRTPGSWDLGAYEFTGAGSSTGTTTPTTFLFLMYLPWLSHN